ncbi:preprotein translocase subunit SecG [Roseivirga misakiensis]|uniref:Protein-export membrane protein SecG n=1 Tax=Roseivirga misakiensis TaxID=1563681 RepID=A0A1E5SYW6_9BACT|nr:preprotein translocase subunit SecG [Roseivirga misakiensis]OEK04311.1 preprotein translocase subunit SecG [Roseivirga misakiensis]
MFQLFIILAIIVAVLLVLIVLMQNSKGGGLSSQFGGGGAQQIIGVKKTGDLLEKTTWIFVIVLIVLSLASSMALKDGSRAQSNPNIDAAQQSLPTPVPTIADTTQTGLTPVPEDTAK